MPLRHPVNCNFVYFEFSDFPESSKHVTKKQKLQDVPNVDGISPALGITWSHCVNTRLIAQFFDSTIRQVLLLFFFYFPIFLKLILNCQ